MRVLMVTQPVEGGVYEHVVSLARGLAGRGHHVAVAGPLTGRGEDPKLDVIALELVRAISPAEDVRGALRLAAVERRFRPDVVHAHSSKAGAVARIARLLRPALPVLYTPHGLAFAGHFESERQRTVYRAAERALGPLASRIVCVCEAERRLAAQIAPVTRLRVVHNGVARGAAGARAHPRLAELGDGRRVLGVLTGLRPGKGIETLIDCMPRVLCAHPDAMVVVAGEGPERPQLERRAADRGVGEGVHLIGETAGPDPLLAGTDVLVSPSWAESFPYSLLEAMASAVPVVATDVGGCAEAVEHGRTGLLVPPRDPAALAAAIIEVLDDGERGRAMGEAGRLRQRELFTLDRMVDRTLEVYGEVATAR